MGQTNADGIWTPDEDDTMEPDVWAPMMGESISNGLGKRMALQETRVSLRATTPVPFDVVSTDPATPYTQVPLGISFDAGIRGAEPDFSAGNHATGILIEGNYAKIVTPGLYTINGQVTIYSGGHPAHAWDFYAAVSGTLIGIPAYGSTNDTGFTSGFVSDTRFLAKDDMISLTVGLGTDHVGGMRVQDALLTVAMSYAVPEA